jgi:hypothetical protein
MRACAALNGLRVRMPVEAQPVRRPSADLKAILSAMHNVKCNVQRTTQWMLRAVSRGVMLRAVNRSVQRRTCGRQHMTRAVQHEHAVQHAQVASRW